MRDLPFVISRKHEAGATREAARFTCQRCDAEAEMPLVRQRTGFNPEATVKRAERAGWRIAGPRVKCPACVDTAAAGGGGEKPGPKLQPKMLKMPDPKTVTRDAVLREASPQERVKIRAVLDKHFDDGAGCWLDGYSDQKAGEEVGVPWAIVTRIREAAYGPIRVDPEVVALRAEMVQIARDIVALNDRHAAAVKRLDALTAKRVA